jgi:hypothetical protein
VRLGFTPTIRMRDVYFSNADWSKENKPMAKFEHAGIFDVAARPARQDPDPARGDDTAGTASREAFRTTASNWVLAEPTEETKPSKLRISTLSVDHGRLRYIDHGEPFELDVLASTFDPSQPRSKAKDADSPPSEQPLRPRNTSSSGKYHGAGFSGEALTGEVLSFQESGVPFPVKGDLRASTTRVNVEGTIADAANISGIDTHLRIEGKTWRTSIPSCCCRCPLRRPTQLQGHLVLKGNRYSASTTCAGRIGSTDVQGKASYVEQRAAAAASGRPFQQAA